MKPEDMKILVIGDRVWGRGDTLDQAIQKAERTKHYIAYVVHPDTHITQDGSISFPHDFPPKEFYRKLPKRKGVKS